MLSAPFIEAGIYYHVHLYDLSLLVKLSVLEVATHAFSRFKEVSLATQKLEVLGVLK